MTSLCAVSGTSVYIGVYYYVAASASNTVTEITAGTSTTGTETATLIAFGVSGYATSGIFDGSCIVVTGTSLAPSLTLSGLADGNDFVFAGVASLAQPLSTTSPSTQIASVGVAAGTGSVALGGASAYQLGTGVGSYTLAFSTTTSAAWTEVGAAIKNSTPIPVPLFPEGVAPLLVMIPIVYVLLRRKKFGESTVGVAN